MTDRWLPTRLRRTATIIKGERALERVVRAALGDLAGYCRRALDSASMDASVLSAQHPEWQRIVDEDIMPAVEAVFRSAFDTEARTVTAAVAIPEPQAYASSIADLYAGRYLTGARNRMVGVSQTMFDKISATLQEGRQAVYTLPDGTEVSGESIPLLSQRVDALLGDDQRWTNRATVVARTEVISANNAGARASAAYNAGVLGIDESLVVKEWLATADGRTRETHLDADGQQVLGVDTPFVVGGYDLQEPGDLNGPAEEVIQCRCTALYHYPGDAAYPDDLDAGPGAPGPMSAEDFAAGARTGSDWYKSDPRVLAVDSREFGRASNKAAPYLNGRLKSAAPDDIDIAAGGHAVYIGHTCKDINRYLRGQELTEFSTELVEGMNDAVDEFYGQYGFALDERTLVYRGVEPTADWTPDVFQVGDYAPEPGWSSVTTNAQIAEDYGATSSTGWLYEIAVPQGAKVVPGDVGIEELVLKRGSVFRIVSKDSASRVIRMELVP